ncbi:MAG: DsbA family protein [Pseudomonadota bacterium]
MHSRSMLALCALTGASFIGGCSEAQNAEAQVTAEGAAPATISDAEFDRMLRDALMRRPEVIIEAIEAYRAQMEADAEQASRQALAGLLPELIEAKAGHAIGASAEDAEIVVVEFFDYHCGFCKRALDDVIALTASDPTIRVVFQELPILREESRDAALAALAAGAADGPEAYSAVHRELMQAEGALDEDAINAAIKRAGSNPRTVTRTLDQQGDDIEARLDRSIEMARQIGISGTPYFVMVKPSTNDTEVLSGYLPQMFAETLAALDD